MLRTKTWLGGKYWPMKACRAWNPHVCRGQGLAFMHSRQRLHQALGPTSVLLDRVDELDAERLTAR